MLQHFAFAGEQLYRAFTRLYGFKEPLRLGNAPDFHTRNLQLIVTNYKSKLILAFFYVNVNHLSANMRNMHVKMKEYQNYSACF